MQRYLALAVMLCGALRAETVLVLPFFNHARPGSLDWIGESIAETVGDTLRSEGVLVLDRDDRLEVSSEVLPGSSVFNLGFFI